MGTKGRETDTNHRRNRMTKIFTMTHKKFLAPVDSTYIPLQVGRAVNGDLGYIGDDTGENISDQNCYYGELTGIYWLWKNYKERENIGVCHYRRFFINSDRQILSEQDYDDILKEYDIITSKAMFADEPYRDYYAKAHNVADLDEEGRVIQELYPEDYEAFCKVMSGTKHYFGNLMVTSYDRFMEYCRWLFAIFFELQKRIDVSSYDAYHRRVFGFLSEQLLLVWITARGLKVYECSVGISEEKAETKEFKLAIGQLIRMDRITEARQMFYDILKLRPDIRLEHSDLNHEVPDIEQILYICELEQQKGKKGMLDYSRELSELIRHFRKITAILEQNEWDSSQIIYLEETFVTPIAVEVIARNHIGLQENWCQAMEQYDRYIFRS